MSTTQEHISISGIANDILLLKNGGAALVLEVSAVNFGLLSVREQMAIIYSFAQMLNSLSFTIQIAAMSKRLNISSYLKLLDQAQKAQTNPLLASMIIEYKQFIQSTIKENEVLDKSFYIVIPLFSLELGLTVSQSVLEQKIKTVLLPRKDQVIKQLRRVGLTANQLSKKALIELFYNIYNEEALDKPVEQQINPQELQVKLNLPKPAGQPQTKPAPAAPAATVPLPTAAPAPQPYITIQNAKAHPFVVEELEG